MRTRILQSLLAFSMAVTLLLIQATRHPAMAQESDSLNTGSDRVSDGLKPSDVKQIFVPAQNPKVWPKGDWEVIDSREYRRLLKGLKRKQPEPASARISHAKYQATFTGKNLHAGQLTATIQHTTDSQFLSLDPINLAIASLWWDEEDKPRKAIWGNAAEGETLLVLPDSINSSNSSPMAPNKTLRGEWSAAGRKFSNRFEFDLKLLPATVNELELSLPRNWTLTSSVGAVEGPLEFSQHSQGSDISGPPNDRFRKWNVQMGSEQEGQLTLHQSSPGKPSPGLLLAESDTTYLVHERELQVEARYELDAAYAPISQVVFEVPSSIRIYAITYGTETNLEWHLKTRGRRQQVVIQLPDPLLGKSRPIRIQGLGRVQSGRAWQLPMITCSQAALLRRKLHLTVDAPLELRSNQATGFRQTAISVQPDQRETLTFSQIAPDTHASFTAFIGTPAFSVASQIVSRLTTGTEEWQIRSEVTWLVQAGSRFLTTCEVRPGWEILDVRQSSDSTLPVIADWRVLKGKNGEPAKLRVEFLEALTPMQSKRVLVLARRLPLTTGQTLSLACVEPLSCRSVEEFLWVESQSSASNILLPDPSSEIQRRTLETLPTFVQQSPLFSAESTLGKREDAVFFHSLHSNTDGRLTLNTTEPPYKASVNVLVECTKRDLHETLTFAIEPLDTPIDRLTVSAADLGEDWSWVMQSQLRMPNAMPLRVELQKSLPGEDQKLAHWNLRLPAPQTKPFELIAKRKRPIKEQHGVALPFLPAAQKFFGTVEFQSGTDLPWDAKTTALEEAAGRSNEETLSAKVRRRWHYLAPDAQMIVERGTTDAKEKRQLGRLQLTSLLYGNSHSAIHRARYDFKFPSNESNFSFQLPERVKLIEVLVNGTPVATTKSEQGFVHLPRPVEQKNSIEVRYESEWKTGGIVSSLAVPLPQTNVKILEFRWRFGLSPNLELVNSPRGLSLATERPQTHWTKQFFGPLGRGSTVEPFRPWKWSAWETLFVSTTNQQKQKVKPSSSNFLPSDWRIYEAHAPRIGEMVELKVWNQSIGRRWAWVAFLTSMIIGFGLRMKVWNYRRQLGLFWFLANFAGAGLLPMPWAMIAGGSLAGTLLALLFPRRFILTQRKPANAPVLLGSTASFEHQPILSLTLLLTGGFSILAVCHFGSPQIVQGQQSSPAKSENRKFNVLIPSKDSRNPQFETSVVYVDRGFLKKLRDVQPKPSPEASYLISFAKYQAEVNEQNSVEMTARFDVVVLDPHQPVTVRLPLNDVFLGGPGHCLVDGQPHPVLLDPHGKGYLIELAPQNFPIPAIADKPKQTLPETRNHQTRQITLRLHSLITSLPNGGRISFSVPAVSSSDFQIRFPENYTSIGVRGLPGQIHSSRDSKSLLARIGATKKLEVFWRRQTNSVPPTNEQPPKVFALATIHPLQIEWQIRVTSVSKWTSSSKTWKLPANTFVRELKATQPVSYEVTFGKTDTELMVEIPDPAPGELTVDITCMTPRDQSFSALPRDVQIPRLDLFDNQSKTDMVQETEYQIGVVATPELEISPLSPDFLVNRDIHSISPEKFLNDFRQAATETRTLRNPQYAWRLPKPSRLELTQQPRLPKRSASVSQEGRIRKGEIHWTFNAKIDTTTATAFRHVLRVPIKLMIDSVSIQEDETERLVRWSRLGNRLELVLSDGTTGNQSVVLTGHLPIELERGKKVSLPLIQIEEAAISDSRLRLYQDYHAGHELQLGGIDDLPVLDANGVKTKRGIPQLLAGVHLTDGNASPTLIVGNPLEQIHLHHAMVVDASDAKHYLITNWIHFKKLKNSPQRFSVRLPSSMTSDFRVELLQKPGEIVPYETITQPDQSLELVFDSVSFQEQDTLRIASTVVRAAPVSWKLPQVKVTNAQVDSFLLGIPSTFTFQSFENVSTPTPIPQEDFPDWMPQDDSEGFDIEKFQLYRALGERWLLIPNLSPKNRLPQSPLVQTTLWLTDPQSIVGETHFELSESTQESITWTWPQNTTLRGAIRNGKFLSPTIDREAQTLQLTIPLVPKSNGGARRLTLDLYWMQEFEKPIPRFGQINLTIPKPQSKAFQSAILTVIHSDDTELITNEGLDPISQTERANSPMPPSDSLRGNLSLDTNDWSLSFWTMDSRAEGVFLVCVLVLISGGVLHWGLRLNSGEWLHHHPAIAWASLGLIWWACLTGSLFGFALFVLSPLFAMAAKIQAAKSPDVKQSAST